MWTFHSNVEMIMTNIVLKSYPSHKKKLWCARSAFHLFTIPNPFGGICAILVVSSSATSCSDSEFTVCHILYTFVLAIELLSDIRDLYLYLAQDYRLFLSAHSFFSQIKQ